MLKGETNLNNTAAAPPAVGTIVAAVEKTPEKIRALILNAIGSGYNTMLSLVSYTGIDNTTLTREIGYLDGIYIVTVPGPPVDSYWLKSKRPRGRIVIDENGNAVEIKREKSSLGTRNVARKNDGAEKDASAAPIARSLPRPAEMLPDEYREDMPLALLEEHPENPRGAVNEDEQAFLDLTANIKVRGVEEPLVVTRIPNTNKFRIVLGHRRNKAAVAAGRETVPCIIRSYSSDEDEDYAMLSENLLRRDLSPIQEAKSFKKALDRAGGDVHTVARNLGVTQSTITNRVKLLNLHVGIQIMIDRGELGTGTGEALSSLSHEQQMKILPRAQKMTVSDLRQAVSEIRATGVVKISKKQKQKVQEKRVTRDEEKFTRSGAVARLETMGDEAWLSVGIIREAFNDVCADTCVEANNPAYCNACPAPRMIEAIFRQMEIRENAA